MSTSNDKLRKTKINITEACIEIETQNRAGKTRDHFIKIREITIKFRSRIGILKSRTGKYLTKETQVKGRWKDYTETLNKRESNMMATIKEREYEQEPIMIECEVCRAQKELANGKAAGVDEIQ